MGWFDNLMPSRIKTKNKNQQIPDGLWLKCSSCSRTLYRQDVKNAQYVCPECGHHMRISARERLQNLFDADTEIQEIAKELQPIDFLKFKDSKRYKDRISQANKASGESDALIAMAGKILGRDFTAAAFEFSYMGGSMGSVVGERFVRAVEHAIAHKTPFVCFAASGGARMQEGLTSLMQMAKTSAALTQLHKAGLPFISVLTDPTMGGVSASFAMLGDLIIAEPGALIGFAGPRVIEQTVRETLPEGFQRSEFLLEKGAIDMIVDRRRMREELASICAMLLNEAAPEYVSEPEPVSTTETIVEAVADNAAAESAPNDLQETAADSGGIAHPVREEAAEAAAQQHSQEAAASGNENGTEERS